jgi:hypothetical protein
MYDGYSWLFHPSESDPMLPKYHSYLLRLWQAGPADNPTWRASIENPHTHQLTGFDSLEALCDYIKLFETPSGSMESQSNSLPADDHT